MPPRDLQIVEHEIIVRISANPQYIADQSVNAGQATELGHHLRGGLELDVRAVDEGLDLDGVSPGVAKAKPYRLPRRDQQPAGLLTILKKRAVSATRIAEHPAVR